MSHRPLFMSSMNASTLSTVFSETCDGWGHTATQRLDEELVTLSPASLRPENETSAKPRRTWHSRWMALNESVKEFSLQNCRMILMTS